MLRIVCCGFGGGGVNAGSFAALEDDGFGGEEFGGRELSEGAGAEGAADEGLEGEEQRDVAGEEG